MSELEDIWHRTPEERHSDEKGELRGEIARLRAELAAALTGAEEEEEEEEDRQELFKARAELANAWGDAYALIEKYAPEQDDLLDAVRARMDALLNGGEDE